MKKLFLLLTFSINFCTTYAQVANPVSDLTICDDEIPDGISVFDLTVTEQQVLGSQDPSEFQISYYQTQADADTGENAITSPLSYTNIFNPQTIYIRVEELATGNYDTTTLDLVVEQAPIANTPMPLRYCDPDNDGFGVFTLTDADNEITGGVAGLTVSYHTTLSNANNDVDAINTSIDYNNIIAETQTIYARVEYTTTAADCATVVELQLIVEPTPLIVEPTPLEVCDDASADGFASFDLTSKEVEILDGLNPAQYAISYFENESDAVSSNNPIVNPTSYINTVGNFQIIWMRIEDINTIGGCYTLISLDLIVNPLPVLVQPTPLELCDDNFDEINVFDLTVKDSEITGGNPSLSVTYYVTNADAEAQINAISDPTQYTNTGNPQTLYVVVTDTNTGCFDSTTLTLRVNPVPSPSIPVPDIDECDDDNDGFLSFDLTVNEAQILNGETDVFITYYESFDDANAGENPILDPTNYTNISPNSQTIYVRVENITGCYTLVNFDIVVISNCNSGSELVMQNGTFNICDGIFTDSGGEFGNYSSNENLTITICPENSGDVVALNFLSFSTQINLDVLTIYDGDSTASNLIGSFSATNSPGLVYASETNESGCLTFNFTSNATGITSGWVAEIQCVQFCEPFTPIIDISSHTIANSGVYIVGIDETIDFEASTTVEGLQLGYSWDLGDGTTLDGASITHQFMDEGTYEVTLNANLENSIDCNESVSVTVVVLGENVVVYPTQYTVEELISDVFLGAQCSMVSNVTYSTGTTFDSTQPNGISYFASNGSNFPMTDGLVLTTGDASRVGGPNVFLGDGNATLWPGDSDLDTTLGVNSSNATIIEFDFVPVRNEISFDFLFTSEEYDMGSFECSFSDAFAFLLTDAQGNTTNLAVLPGSGTPILVTTVHPDNGFCPAVNEEYFGGYIQNGVSPISFDGMTTLLTAESDVNIGEQYHIKLVIADDGDANFDSGVFLRAGSLDIGELCNDVGLINTKAFMDENSNGFLDPDESDFVQGYFTYEKNNDGIINQVNTNLGNFSIVSTNETDTYDITFNIYDEYTNCYVPITSSVENLSVANGDVVTVNFPIENNQSCQDVAVYLVNPFDAPRPGFDYLNQLIIENVGNSDIISGTVEVVLDEQLSFNGIIESNPDYTVTTTDSGFTLDFVNLEVGETEVVNISLNCDVTAQLDDIVTNTATYVTDSNDIEESNNQSSLAEIVIGSYDPNDIFESHGPEIVYDDFVVSDEWLYYTIRFQNLGTAEAIFVRIEDDLDLQLDESTFQMLRSSHDYTVTRTGSSLEWYFEDIDLPAEQDDEPGSHGFVHFKIKPKSGYEVGDIIPNSAAIYFDFNPPVITNTFNTQFVEPLSVNEFNSSNYSVYPNPAKDRVTVSARNNSVLELHIELVDLQGKRIQLPQTINDNTAELNVTSLKSGVYFIKINDGQKVSINKLIIE